MNVKINRVINILYEARDLSEEVGLFSLKEHIDDLICLATAEVVNVNTSQDETEQDDSTQDC